VIPCERNTTGDSGIDAIAGGYSWAISSDSDAPARERPMSAYGSLS
jgi:hypothetical protein